MTTTLTLSGQLLDDCTFDDLPEFVPTFARTRNSVESIGAITIDSSSEWMSDAVQKIVQLRHLPSERVPYGASPPNDYAVSLSLDLLNECSQIDLKPSAIDASSDEGICISFTQGDRYADVECFNTGEILAATRDSSRPTDIRPLDSGQFHEIVTRIDKFLSS